MKKTLALLLALLLALGVMMPSAAFAAKTNLAFTVKIVDDDNQTKKVERTTKNLITKDTPLLSEVVKMVNEGYSELESVFAGSGLGTVVNNGLAAYATGMASWKSFCDSNVATIEAGASRNFKDKARTEEASSLTVGDLVNDSNNTTVMHFEHYTVTITLVDNGSTGGDTGGGGGTGSAGGGGGGGNTPSTPDQPDKPDQPDQPDQPVNETVFAIDQPVVTEDYTVTPVKADGETQVKKVTVTLTESALSRAKDSGKGGKVLLTLPVTGDGNVVMQGDPGDPIEYAVVKDGKAYVLVDGNADLYIKTRVDLFPDTFNHWSKDDVDFTAGREIFNGVSETERRFDPDASLTRGMLVTVLYRLESASAQGIAGKFDDVPAGEWYADAVNWAAEAGIVMGVGEGRFAPDQEINREEIATMLYRYIQKCGYTITGSGEINFTDKASISDWAMDAVEALVKAGVLNGKENGAYDPTACATRGEASTILARFIRNVVA